MKKLLSVAIPCYNSAAYMRNCIESLLPGGDRVEIIIVDDGSKKDDTPAVADEYAERYPDICKVVHQENGGHGEAVNSGLKAATGHFFKVVDSDDRVDAQAYEQVLEKLEEYSGGGNAQLDMLITNFVYDKQGAAHKKNMQYHSLFPVGEVFGWEDVKLIRTGQYLLMHSVIYRTELLRKSGLSLPKHTFYVDNIFVFQPLPLVKRMYYLDVDFYLYYIGREDQSVNERVMIGRIDQQYRVTRLMLGYFAGAQIPKGKLRRYMINYLDIMMAICSILAIRSGDEENMKKKDRLWAELKSTYPSVYKKIRFAPLGTVLNLPGKGGRKVAVAAYSAARKIFGFN